MDDIAIAERELERQLQEKRNREYSEPESGGRDTIGGRKAADDSDNTGRTTNRDASSRDARAADGRRCSVFNGCTELQRRRRLKTRLCSCNADKRACLAVVL